MTNERVQKLNGISSSKYFSSGLFFYRINIQSYINIETDWSRVEWNEVRMYIKYT